MSDGDYGPPGAIERDRSFARRSPDLRAALLCHVMGPGGDGTRGAEVVHESARDESLPQELLAVDVSMRPAPEVLDRC
jgi:hypothetical protein